VDADKKRIDAVAVLSPRTDADVQFVTIDANHCVATWHQTVVEIWRGPASVEGANIMVQTCQKLIANGKGSVTFIAILERTSPPPEQPVRTVLARWSRDVVPLLAVATMVSEGSGFRAALVRGVGLALTALVPHKVPFKFCSDVEEAVLKLAPALPPRAGGSAGLRSAIEIIRAKMG
jgi:hypothetical protein